MDVSTNSSSERKSALESLDREELIQRCKTLLGIAKKAKQAKDDCQTKIDELKEKLTECNTQKQADKECLKTMQMMVDSLTDNKLNAANKIADLEKTIKHLNQQLSNCNEKLSELEIENEAKDKQIQRLTSENEEQEMDLRNLDERLAKVSELSQHQKQELILLEQSVDRWKAMEMVHHKLQAENKELQAKVASLNADVSREDTILVSQHNELINLMQIECDSSRHLYEETKLKLDALQAELEQLKQAQGPIDDDEDDGKIDVIKEQLQHENKQFQKQCDEQAHKLNKYKAKVCEFSSKLKELKVSKKLLTDTVLEYSNCVTKWQVQIAHASKLLINEVNHSNELKTMLENQLADNENVIKELYATIDILENRLAEASKTNGIDEIQQKYDELLVEHGKLSAILQGKNNEMAKFHGLSEAKNKLEQQLESSEYSIRDLKATIDGLEVRLDEVSKCNASTENSKKKYETLLLEYESLQKDIEEKNNEIINYNGMNETKIELERQLESSENLVRDLKASVEELENRLIEVSKCDEIAAINEKYDSLQIEFKALQSDIEEKNLEISDLNEAKLELKQQVENSEHSIKDLLENRLAEVSKCNETIKEKYEMLLIEYKALQKDIIYKNTEISTLTQEFEQVCTGLTAENEKSKAENQKLSAECQNQLQQISQLQANEATSNEKNAELLAEMRELNDILKARGELISKQTADIDQIKGELSEQSKQMCALEESLKEKTKQLEQLRNQFDSQSEILSTSTISRADEVARMRDIEDSFEEKYNKLRILAVKLKKKVAEQQAIITNLECTTSKSAETNNAVSVAPVPAQNLISFQRENDRLLDQIDSMKSEQKQLKTEINELKQQIKKADEEAKSLRIVNEDIKATADANAKIKSALDEKIRGGEKQIEALKNENKNVTQQLKNAENEIIKIKDIVKQKENEVTQKEETVSKIKSEMNKLKATMKKSNVLNFEVEAYEKSLTEVSLKYDTTLKQLTEAKTEIESHQATIKKLTTEIQALTNQLELEKQNSNEYQQQNELQRIKMKENGAEIGELKRIIDDHVKEANHIKIELANLQSQQSENEIEKQKFIGKLKTENEMNVSKILTLEEEVQELRTKLSGCEQELANVQTDFASYKIRAQAVLRQNQTKDSVSEEELKEELAILMQAKEDLKKKLTHTVEQQRRFESTLDELKGEKTNLQERCKKLLSLLDESRQQVETMQIENRKLTQEHHEALKMHRLQIDTLNNCFKGQIEEMQKKHEEEFAALKTATVAKGLDSIDASLSLSKGAQLTTEQRIELLMMERQDGEGSECTTSTHPRKVSAAMRGKHDVIPLDELLNNTFDEEPAVEQDEHDEKVVPKEKFEAQQSRVKHLSTLLSEAEMDVARLTEMNTMIKEELRRQERSTEREKQMQNLEYMKNVIFKFLTINNADERAHLVPVLNIILKLSPDENRTLQSVARGNDGGQSGWSNLLPTW